MLIEFSVSNFRSFREKQSFSMVAAPRLRNKDNVFSPGVSGEKIPDLLKVAAIYGPNASGKSNLIKALSIVSQIARLSPTTGSIPLPVVPFRFDPDLAAQPSCFEVNFVHSNSRYQFKLSAVADRIVYETLIAYPQGKATVLYERRHAEEVEAYVFGRDLEGGNVLHEAWRKLTGPKSLFIAQAVANSSEELTQLRTPFEWLSNSSVEVRNGLAGFATRSQRLAKDHPSMARNIASFLQDLDVPVTAINFDPIPVPVSPHDIYKSGNALLPTAGLSLPVETRVDTKIRLTHKTALGEANFDFDEESDGTKGLFGFWLPWTLLGTSPGTYQVLIVDELDSSLHPEIVANLIRKHLQVERPAQLIFTTHDTHLMDTKLLRRDQFWITERDANGATQLRSIHAFEGRESEDVEKKYYEGRYRGLPLVRKG
jgi:energy-coupling factor transporter ATP-binding protein EcfA2